MNNIDLSPDNFPEPIKSLIKSLDLNALQGLLGSMPPNDASNMVQGILGLLKNSMPQQDYQALEQLIGTLAKNRGQ